ncbi:MAG: hypothetical protein ACPLXM_06070 [Bacteroidales bacterium]
MKRIKAGFAGFGEVNSPQGLIRKKCLAAQKELEAAGFELVSTDHITDDPEGNDVQRAIKDLKKADFDLLIVCIAGWIPSHAVIAVTEEFRSKPIILWGLAGDLEGDHLITTAPQAGTTALRKVFDDLGYTFKYVYNFPGNPSPIGKILSYAVAATASASLRNRRVGMVGFRDMRLYNTLYEGLSLKSRFGIEIEFFEMLELVSLAKEVKNQEVRYYNEQIKNKWVFLKKADEQVIEKGIAYFLALKEMALKYKLNAISLKDVDGMKKLLEFPPAMVFMLISDEAGLCTIPENDAMGAVTQLIIKELTGQCAAYLEFYDFFEKSLLLGVPDFVPSEIVEGGVKVMPAAFGNIAGGLLNVSSIKTGEVTLARLSNTGATYSMHFFKGDGRRRSWEEAGWDKPAPQLPSLEVFVDDLVDNIAQKITGQHYILAYGNHVETIKDFCSINSVNIS